MSNFIHIIFNNLLHRNPNQSELDIFKFAFKSKFIKKTQKKKFVENYIKSTNEYKQIYKDDNLLNNIYNFYLERDIENDALISYNNYINNDLSKINKIIDGIKISKEYYYKKLNLSLWNNYIENIKIKGIIEVQNQSINNCIIVEPRNHRYLEKIIYKFAEFLGHKFQFQIFHGNNNVGLINNIKNNKIKNLKSFNLDIENLTINEYSDLLKSEIFWNNVEGENILLFQTDAIILKNFSDEYFQYDYIGAPWKNLNSITNNSIGNGGLSFRKKSVMLEIIKKYKDDNLIEDLYFSKYLKIENKKLPNIDLAKKFCVENVYYHDPTFLHKPFQELEPHELSFLLKM